MKIIRHDKKLLPSIKELLQKNVINSVPLAKVKIKSKCNLHFTLIEGVHIQNIKAIQSVFAGVVFRNCIIEKCNFSRSDFEGVSFENCYLKNVNYNNTDIRTVNFSKSKIIECTFQDSIFLDNYFVKCVLNSCIFAGSNVSRCNFEDSILHKLVKTQISTWLHNKFKNCSLRNMNFFDCTFSYGIFKNCKIRNTMLNADSLGLTFGLTLENLTNMSYGYLGDKFEDNTKINIENLLRSYYEQGWGIQFYISSINFLQSVKINLFINLFQFINNQIEYMAGPTKDDLEFINNVMIELCKDSSLPFSAILEMKIGFSSTQKNFIQKELTNIIYQNLLLLHAKMSDNLLSHIEPLLQLDNNHIVNVEMVFIEKPTISILELFTILKENTKCLSGTSKLLNIRKGSWIEVLSTPISNLIALTILIYAINGVLVSINSIKKTSKKLFSIETENKPKTIQINLTKNIPENITLDIKEINKLLTTGNREMIEQVFESLKKLKKIDIQDNIDYE